MTSLRSSEGSSAAGSHPSRMLGKSDLVVGPLAWGMWRFRGSDVTAAQAKVEAALENGMTLFDTADVYGLDNRERFGAAEELLGKVFASSPSLRSSIVLATKAGIEPGTPYNSRAEYLIAAVERALQRLNIEQIDLFQIHRPDLLAHPAEIAQAFDSLRERGHARYFGVSNHTAQQYETLSAFVSAPLVSTQPELSPLALESLTDGVLDVALRNRAAVLAWSPFAGGRLAAPSTDRERAVAAAITKIADREQVTAAAVSYAWVMAHPSRPLPIVGSQSPSRLREAQAAMSLNLSRLDWYDILTASRQERLP